MDNEGVDHGFGSPSFSDSSTDSSGNSSSDIVEDATSFSPLFEMSSLMEDLPIKRGLSKHFQGKSQSFTSLASVTSLEDLSKSSGSVKKKLKSCKRNHVRSLDRSSKYFKPMMWRFSSRIISKNKVSKWSSSLTSMTAKRPIGFREPP